MPAVREPCRRDPWSLDPEVVYLNHGAYGACPAPVLAAQQALRDRMEADPTRFFGRELGERLDRARAEVAAFLRADPDGLVFVRNATAGVNTVVQSLRFEPGDELLTTDHEYNATLNALEDVARRDGARVVVARIPLPIADPAEATAAILAAVSPRTRLAMISHVTSPTAIVLPIEAIVPELQARGVDVLVDAAHSPGQVPVDVGALGAAYWTANGHKWLCGPKGAAVLWVREDRRDRIRPLVISHGANDPRTDRPRLLLEADWTGTGDPTPELALPEAIRFVGGLEPGGWPALMAANHERVVAARRHLAGAFDLELPAPESMLGAMATLALPGRATDAAAADLMARLAEEDGIEVPVVGWPVRAARARPDDLPALALLRISWHRYVAWPDVEALAEALGRRLGRPSETAAG